MPPKENVYTLIGDVNVKRNVTSLNMASRGVMKSAQFLDVGQLSSVSSVFSNVRQESNVCIFAGFTEFLSSVDYAGTVLGTIDPVLESLQLEIRSFCEARSSVMLILTPPLYLSRPSWYRTGLPEIGARFSSCFASNPPPNLHLMPGFSCQDLLQDGVHLTPVSGLHYLLHLFDRSEYIMQNLKSAVDDHLKHGLELARQNQDRIIYLERDHSRLVSVVDDKLATSAEFDDWTLNRSEEDWIVITGLPRLSSSLTRGDWQRAAKDQVSGAISQVLRANNVQLGFTVNLVVNAVRGRTSGRSIYNVRLSSAETARRIRELFSGFFRRQNPVRCPPGLTDVGFRNKVTLETRIRLAIMKQLGENYKNSNPGSSYFLRGYESRPQLVLVPPREVTDSRPKTLHFISAVKTLPSQLSDENLVPIYRVIGNNLRGRLASLFIVLKDDDHDRLLRLVREADSSARGHGSGQQGQPRDGSRSYSGVVSGSGSGMEVNSQLAAALLRPPPPPPPGESPVDTAKGRSRPKRKASPSRRRGSKRSRRSRKARRRSPSSSSSSSETSTSSGSSSSSSYSSASPRKS